MTILVTSAGKATKKKLFCVQFQFEYFGIFKVVCNQHRSVHFAISKQNYYTGFYFLKY